MLTGFRELRALQDVAAPERRRWRVGSEALRAELAQIEASAGDETRMRLCAIDLAESTELAMRVGVSCATTEFLGIVRGMHGTMQLGFWRSERASELVRMARAKFSHDVAWLEALAGDARALLETSKPHMRARFGGRLVLGSDTPPRVRELGGQRSEVWREDPAGDAFVIATGIRALQRLTRVAAPTPQDARLLLLRADARLRGSGAIGSVQAAVRRASSVDGWIGGEVRDWFVGAMDSLLVAGMTPEQLLLQVFSRLHCTISRVAGAVPVGAVMLVGEEGAVPFLLAESGLPEGGLYRSAETRSAFRMVSTRRVVGTRTLYELHAPMAEDLAVGGPGGSK